MPSSTPSYPPYRRMLLFIAGMGGLLYGLDVGIISAALLYLNKTVQLTEAQTSFIVAAVFGGSMVSSLVAGLLADWFGRKTMIIVSALMFLASIGLIVISQEFAPLFLGRLLQGMSGGVIAVVVPLYLAECLDARSRGRGSAIFQLMLTVGIVIASLAGYYYIHQADEAIKAAKGDSALILAAQNAAWRHMFLSVIYPGGLFFFGTLWLSESPRWLFRRGEKERALAALCRSCAEDEAQLEWREMEVAAADRQPASAAPLGSLWQRKYLVPFVLACVVLTCNQTTGINSILPYLVVILKQAGLSAELAVQGDVAVKLLNCLMTVVALPLVDRRGRKFLLKLGTGGVVLALAAAALLFGSFEFSGVDVRDKILASVQHGAIDQPLAQVLAATSSSQPMALNILYSYGAGDIPLTLLSNEKEARLKLAPPENRLGAPLTLKRARYGPVPSPLIGGLVTASLCLFIASFAVGPGVCVWLVLTELLPTRIRSVGMGIALLLNQGVSTGIAAVFLPVVGRYGYSAMFIFLAGCTVIYWCTAAFFLPETKGRSLEEIEAAFASPASGPA